MRKMKDSGIEWIGEIPENYDVKRLKFLATICNGQDFKNIQVDEGRIPVIGSGGEFARASEYLYDKPSVLLGRKGTIDKPLYIDTPFWTVDTMYYTMVHDGVIGKYLYYLCQNIEFDYYQYGSTLPSMTQRDLNDIYMPLPRYYEQEQIVKYLDKKCEEIDSVIKAKETTNKKLKEYRQNTIYEAVTKGLEKNISMKDSGIEWIGEIPIGWDFTKLKYFCIINSGSFISNNEYDDEGEYPVIGGNGITGYCNKVNIKTNCIVIGRVGALCGNVHLIDKECWVTDNALTVVLEKSINIKYLYYILKAYDLNRVANRSAQPLITGTQAGNIEIPIINQYIQQEIVEFLDKKCTEIDSVIAANEKTIQKLKEYRQSIIYEAVTGKTELYNHRN